MRFGQRMKRAAPIALKQGGGSRFHREDHSIHLPSSSHEAAQSLKGATGPAIPGADDVYNGTAH